MAFNKRNILRLLLITVVFYSLYVGVGVFLVASGRIDKWHVFPSTVFASGRGTKYNESQAGADGPLILYRGGIIVSKQVIADNRVLKVKTDSFSLGQKKHITVSCTFDDHREWNFNTSLKDELVNEAVEYVAPDSLLVLSDIEGNFEAFRHLLIAGHVIDSNYQWQFGKGHLVLVGDFFDRGVHVTEVLWLIYCLEAEAAQHGGKVHFILGNHEIMNMSRDHRYVQNKYRENAKLLGIEYVEWYTPDTELGRWLQTKNVVERVGNILFVHGGISEEVNELPFTLSQINDRCRKYYFTEGKSRKELLKPSQDELLFNSKTSPFWYRGYVQQDADEEQVSNTLKKFNASTIVVGHTIVDSITSLYRGRVMAIDVAHTTGVSQALLYRGKQYVVIK